MTRLADEAVSALATLVDAMLSGTSQVGVLVTPSRVFPTGLGGFVAPHVDPVGEVEGARVDAQVRVTVQAQDMAGLNAAATDVTMAMISPPPETLRQDGVLRIRMDDPGGDVRSASGNRIQRDVRFQVLYEFLRFPDAGGGIIEEIPLNIRTAGPGTWLDVAFSPSSLAWFDVVDDDRATTDGPSAWSVDGATQRVLQTSAIRGGQNSANANKPGTYLVLKPRPDVPPLRDFRLTTTVRSSEDGGVGLVFRYRGIDDFYFFHMDAAASYRLLGRKIGGSFSQLDTPALDDTQGFPLDTDLELTLRVQGAAFSVSLDGAEILAGEDTSLVGAGRVGFATRRNTGASFSGLRLMPP